MRRHEHARDGSRFSVVHGGRRLPRHARMTGPRLLGEAQCCRPVGWPERTLVTIVPRRGGTIHFDVHILVRGTERLHSFEGSPETVGDRIDLLWRLVRRDFPERDVHDVPVSLRLPTSFELFLMRGLVRDMAAPVPEPVDE